MTRSTKVVNLSLPQEIFEDVEWLAREENKSRSEVVREALKQYTRTQRLWRQIYCWGEESAKELGITTERDVDGLIHRFRLEQTPT